MRIKPILIALVIISFLFLGVNYYPTSFLENKSNNLVAADHVFVQETPGKTIDNANVVIDINTLKVEVARLNTALITVNKRIDNQRFRTNHPDNDRTNKESAELTEVDITATIQDQLEAEEQYMSHIAHSFYEESSDSEWATIASQAISSAFDSEELAQASVIDIDCRSSLCKLEVSIDKNDPEKNHETQQWISYMLSDTFPSLIARMGEHGQVNTITYYLNRKDHDLPNPEEDS